MLSYTVTIKNLPELQARFRQAPDIASRHILTAGNKSLVDLRRVAANLAPVDTSRLRQSIQISPMRRTGNRLSGSVGTNVKYAEAQETGTGIHGPKKTKIRRVTKKGKVFYVRGVKGRFYMKGSIERNESRINQYFEQAAARIARELST